MEATTKVCSKCGRELPVGMFNKAEGMKDGLRSICKLCQSEYNKEWVAKKKAREAASREKGETEKVQQAIQSLQGLKAFSVNQLVAELKGRGKKVLVDPTPRDAMELLKDAGFKGTLQYVKVETVDISRI